MDTLAQLQAVDQSTLTPLVRRALGTDTLTLAHWRVAPFCDGAGQCVYRFTGLAHDRDLRLPWSLVVKVTYADEPSNPAGARYWKREMLAYQSGLLADLPAGLTAPRCFGFLERPGGEGWLWLEEITGAAPRHWPSETFAAVAQHLGRFGAAYLTARPLPAYPWLSRGWFRSFVAQYAADVAQLPTLRAHPLLRRALPGAQVDRVLQLWQQRNTLFAALDQLPQTLCHLDLNARNLFVRPVDTGAIQCVAIDWESAGVSALGAELASLVGGSLRFDLADRDRAAELEATVLASYLEGVRATGWLADPQGVRLGYTTALALHLVFVMLRAVVEGTRNVGFRQWAEQMSGRPFAELMERDAELFEFFLARADEARQVLGSA
jgi:hypothetical protein